MTTIAYRDGIMAADSCLSETTEEGTIFIGSTDKIVRLGDGSLLGLSGDSEAQLVINVLNNRKIPFEELARALSENAHDCNCLLVRPNGHMFWVTTNSEHWAEYQQFYDGFAALGTGKQFAYGAMEVGATAEAAVLAACRRHGATREPVVTARLIP